MKEILEGILERAFSLHSDVSLPLMAIVASLAGFIILLPKVWPKARFWVTFIHEIGHALTSIFTGGGLRGMKIHKNSAGVAETWRKAGFIGWLTEKLTTWAGYPFPAFVAVVMTVSTNVGFSSALLLVLSVVSALSVFFMRNFRGLGLALLICVSSGLIFWFTPPEFHAVLMLVLSGCLIAGGFKSVLELQAHHRQGDRSESDVAALAHNFKPAEAFVFTSYYFIYVVTTAGSLYFAWLLVQS